MSSDISALPNELLTKIFSLLQNHLPTHSNRPFPTHFELSISCSHRCWINVTRVCRHWRSVALEDPTLWSHINVNQLGSQWTEHYLQHARMAPLAMHYRCFLSESWEGATHTAVEHHRFATLLSCHLDHVQHLNISGAFQQLGTITRCLNSPAPLLESAVAVLEFQPSHQHIELPEVLFAGHAPRLRQLRLHYAAISWDSLSHFNTLTHLDIQHSRNPERQGTQHLQQGGASFEAFLCALEQLSALQDLRLHYSIPPLPSYDEPSIIICPAVRLPNLKLLHLHVNAVVFMVTMKHLTIPAHTRVDLNLSIPRMRGSYDLVVPWLRSHAPNIGPTRSFALSEYWPDGVEIIAQDSHNLAPETSLSNFCDEDDGPMIRMILRSHHRPGEFVQQLRRICGAFRLEEVERVNVFINNWWTPQDWLDIFGRSHRVEHANIGSRCASSFFDALATNYDRDQAIDLMPGNASVLFPSLKVLKLYVVDFYERAREGGYLWERIRDKLQLRRSTVPLETLEIEACRVHAEEVDELRGLVSHVSWDEDEAGYGSTDDFISESEDDDDM